MKELREGLALGLFRSLSFVTPFISRRKLRVSLAANQCINMSFYEENYPLLGILFSRIAVTSSVRGNSMANLLILNNSRNYGFDVRIRYSG